MNMVRNFTNTLLLIICAVLAACSSSDSNNAAQDVANLTGLERFNGTWLLDCALDITTANDTVQEYLLERVVLDDGAIQVDFDTFRDSGCTESFGPGAAGTVTGSYTLGNDITLAEGVVATEMDIDFPGFTQLTLVFRDDSLLYLGLEPDEEVRPVSINFDEPYQMQ